MRVIKNNRSFLDWHIRTLKRLLVYLALVKACANRSWFKYPAHARRRVTRPNLTLPGWSLVSEMSETVYTQAMKMLFPPINVKWYDQGCVPLAAHRMHRMSSWWPTSWNILWYLSNTHSVPHHRSPVKFSISSLCSRGAPLMQHTCTHARAPYPLHDVQRVFSWPRS